MLTVKIVYINGTEDIKECWNLDDISLVGVDHVNVIRDERIKQ